MVASKRINVLVYADTGTSVNAVKQATWSLRRLLGPKYAVLTVTANQILREPWTASCALLVMPGGADLGYCRLLNGEGNRRIKQYVQAGGTYLGFCAGGYYGSSRCEFEVGNKPMEVIGARELAFFPGTCRGLAFAGFVYQSEAGAKAVEMEPNSAALAGSATHTFRSYYNGGGVFADAQKFSDQGVEVLASYTEALNVEAGEAKAAVVYRKIGDGAAILTGSHPEFSGANLDRNEPSNPHYGELVDALIADEKKRVDFMKACLTKLGLDVSQEMEAVPSLSPLHLSAAQPSQIADLVTFWREEGILAAEEGEEYIKGENDTFHLTFRPTTPSNRWSMSELAHSVTDVAHTISDVAHTVTDALPTQVKDAVSSVSHTLHLPDHLPHADPPATDRIPDYNAVIKLLHAHSTALPDIKTTPHFNHASFFNHLSLFHSLHPSLTGDYGRVLLYGEVVSSTNTLLEKNPSLLSRLPIGLVATATTQVAGRGRGSNVWVSPPGSLMFSVVLKHSLSLNTSAPVVFVQYLAALAIVDGIRAYGQGYEALPVKLKWPNDIYALDPSSPAGGEPKYVKIGGILVNSSYSGGDYTLVVGIGLNVHNAAPTSSLAMLATAAGLAPFTLEKLLASVLVQFERHYARFCTTGFDRTFEEAYYAAWLHSGQIVTLETEGGARARITGITRDWGLLVAEELQGVDDRPTGRTWALQSDSNSFDFFRGLLKRKM